MGTFLHGVACGVCLVSGSLTINDMMRRKGTPRCGDEKNAPCRPKGTERRRSAVPLSCFTRSGQYRGPYGGHCPSRSRTHFPPRRPEGRFQRCAAPLCLLDAGTLSVHRGCVIRIILPAPGRCVKEKMGRHQQSLFRSTPAAACRMSGVRPSNPANGFLYIPLQLYILDNWLTFPETTALKERTRESK